MQERIAAVMAFLAAEWRRGRCDMGRGGAVDWREEMGCYVSGGQGGGGGGGGAGVEGGGGGGEERGEEDRGGCEGEAYGRGEMTGV